MNPRLFLQDIFEPIDNCVSALFQLCKLSNINITSTTLKQSLLAHPHYPSLLSISDVLKGFGVENIAAKVEIDKMVELPSPMIVQVSIGVNGESQKYYSVIKAWTKEGVVWTHPLKRKLLLMDHQSFEQIFEGNILLVAADKPAGEKNYVVRKKEKVYNIYMRIFGIIAIPLITVIGGAAAILQNPSFKVFLLVVYFLLFLCGSLVSVVLLWYDIDKHMPSIQKICSKGAKINCNAVLSSPASKIFGIGWSNIGFTYFTGGFIALLISGFVNGPILYLIGCLNVLVVPYIGFSLYYQLKIAKQWCLICLAILAIIFIQFVVCLLGGFLARVPIQEFTGYHILAVVGCLAIPFLATTVLMPALKKAKEGKQYLIESQRLKHDPQIFQSLLANQRFLASLQMKWVLLSVTRKVILGL